MNNTIAFITDNNYVMPTVVAIKSIEQSAIIWGNEYNINICTFNLSSKNISILSSLDSIYIHINVCIISGERFEEKMKEIKQNSHVTLTALLKFELANIFAEYDQILYLDADIIVKGNLSELFNIELGNKYLAASFEFWKFLLRKYEYRNSEDNIPFYFNSGVMLLNLKNIRADNLSDKLWECKINHYNSQDNQKSALMDQDVFNEVFKQKSVHLPIRYNCNCKFVNRKYIKDINKVYNTNYCKVNEIYDDAVIIHYVGKEDKPWIYDTAALRKLWDQYYEKTCFGGFILNRKIDKKNLQYYANALKRSIKYRGIIATVRYITDKGW